MIGVADALKGQVPRGFVVLKAGVSTDAETLRGGAGARGARARSARWRRCAGSTWSPALPKTRSGKILRALDAGDRRRRDEPVPSTIEDPAVLDALRPTLTGRPASP